MAIIIGIDPGSRVTGYGLIEYHNFALRHISSGHLKIPKTDLPEQLNIIFHGIAKIISEFHPKEASIEQIFAKNNINSALKLGQARGAALIALAQQGIKVAEYSPRQIKKAVVGYGAADKNQMQQMVKVLLKLEKIPAPDIADALAIAICHAHSCCQNF